MLGWFSARSATSLSLIGFVWLIHCACLGFSGACAYTHRNVRNKEKAKVDNTFFKLLNTQIITTAYSAQFLNDTIGCLILLLNRTQSKFTTNKTFPKYLAMELFLQSGK